MSKNKKHEHGEHTEEEVLKTECPKCEQDSDKQTNEETAQGEQNQAEKKVENLSAAEKKLAETEKQLEIMNPVGLCHCYSLRSKVLQVSP